MVTQRVIVKAATDEHIQRVEIQNRGRKTELQFLYDSQGLTTTYEVLHGRVSDATLAALMPMLFREFISRINLIKLINEIQLIDRITLVDTISAITNIASVDLIDRISLIDEITKIDTVNVANVQTSGGTNILIDKLTQGAYTENRVTLSNNAAATSGFSATQGTNRDGKFFPRGCKGFLADYIIYCKDAGAGGGTITAYFAPNVGMGAVFSVTVNVAAGGAAADRTATVNRMWNYDSMFVWVTTSSADIQWGYDAGTPYDYYNSGDSGATWDGLPYRIWMKVVIGGDVGDVPVSGIVNNIPIPNSATLVSVAAVNVPDGVVTSILTVTGSGTTVQASLEFSDLTAPTALGVMYWIYIYIDGVLALTVNNEQLTLSQTATTGFTSLGEFHQTTFTYLTIRIPVEFKRSLEVRAYQTTGGAVNTTGKLLYNKIG